MNCVIPTAVELHLAKNHHQSRGGSTCNSIQVCTLEKRSVDKDKYGYLEIAVNIPSYGCCTVALRSAHNIVNRRTQIICS